MMLTTLAIFYPSLSMMKRVTIGLRGGVQETLKVQQAIVGIGWQPLLFYAFFASSREDQFMAEL